MLPISFIVRSSHITREQLALIKERVSEKIARLSRRFKHMQHVRVVVLINSLGDDKYSITFRLITSKGLITAHRIDQNMLEAIESAYDLFKESVLERIAYSLKKTAYTRRQLRRFSYSKYSI